MRKVSAAVTLLLLLATAGLGAPPTITAPAEVKVKVGRFATVPVTTTGKAMVLVSPSEDVDAIREFTDPSVYQFRVAGYTAGTYRLTFVATLGDIQATATTTLTVGDPVPPVPPGPNPPGPVPPGPNPGVPFPSTGLRVLIVYESADLGKMPPAQEQAMRSAKVLDYLRQHCAKDPDGSAAYRIWDKDVTGVENDYPVWQQAMKVPRQATPWIVVSNGTTGTSQPLPGNEADLLALLAKYGGP